MTTKPEWPENIAYHRKGINRQSLHNLTDEQSEVCKRALMDKTHLIDPDMPSQELRLHMGELTAQEERSARAAIRWANSVNCKTDRKSVDSVEIKKRIHTMRYCDYRRLPDYLADVLKSMLKEFRGTVRSSNPPSKISWTCPDCCVNPCDCTIMPHEAKPISKCPSVFGKD